jgi:hypothetical protein
MRWDSIAGRRGKSRGMSNRGGKRLRSRAGRRALLQELQAVLWHVGVDMVSILPTRALRRSRALRLTLCERVEAL